MDKIGLLAGSSNYPVLLAQAAKKRGVKVYAVGLKEETSLEIEKTAQETCWVSVGDLGKAIDFFKKAGIKKAVMAGKVRLSHLFSGSVSPDASFKNLLIRVADKRGDTLLKAVAAYLKKYGIKLIDCYSFLEDQIAEKGSLTKASPSAAQWRDIRFARPLIKKIALMRIGQSMAVKDKSVVAVESMEGTDSMIKRAGRLAGGGVVVVKMSSPAHDMRFDIPLVGPETISAMKEAKAGCLAVEAGRTLLIDKKECARKADEAGVCVVAI